MKIKGIIISVIYLLSMSMTFAQQSTTWRGPNQSGIYPDRNLPDSWPDQGPEIDWVFEEPGEGFSSPAFALDKIFISGMESTTGYIYCLSESGKLIWKAPYGNEFHTSYPGSRATPVISDNMVFILSGVGDLACLDANDGKIIWKKNILREFGGTNTQWGLNETVVIHNDKLICTPGGPTHNMVALEKATGKLTWSSKGKGEISAYCTPLLAKVGSRNLLVTHTEKNIIGVDADNGTHLWSYPHVNRWGVHPNTPLLFNNQVFCFSGYGKGGVMLQLNADGSKATKIWEAADMDSRMGGAVVIDGKIYGSGDNNRDWQCIDWATGKVEYKTREIGNGVIIAADGKLIFYSQRGELVLAKPGASSFQILSKTKVTHGSDQHWAHPVINNGKLYVRHGSALVSYHISK
jgi:outer membrane protein assembly factor BamB